MRGAAPVPAAIALLVLLCGCGSSASDAGTEARDTVLEPAPVTTDAPPEPVVDLGRIRLEPFVADDAPPPGWTTAFTVPYGDSPDRLGTAPGGDDGSLDLGPEYAAPGPDGMWHVLDSAKRRIARFDASGDYLGETVIPRSVLVNGVFAPWQLPRVLDDGTFVAFRYLGEETGVLTARRAGVSEIVVPGTILPVADDGQRITGRDGSEVVALDLTDGRLEPSPALIGRDGEAFDVRRLRGGGLRFVRPADRVDVRIPVRDPDGHRVAAGIEVATGADGRTFVYLIGGDESGGFGALATLDVLGRLLSVVPVPDPFSPSDPGSPARLVVAPGEGTPYLVQVLETGLVVHRGP